MNIILVFLLLINVQYSPIKLKVLDKNTNQPIPYVSYTRITDLKGSFSDENGNIEIVSNLDSKYILSCVGYISDTLLPVNSSNVVFLQPKIVELKEIEVTAKKNRERLLEIGYLKGFSLVPYSSFLSRKMAVCTYFPANHDNKSFVIKKIKIDIGANRSNIFEAFLIRLFIKENINNLPGNDLITKDFVVKIRTNTHKHTFDLQETIMLPKNGCFVGFETIGKIEKGNNFIAFSDFYEKQKKPFQFYVRMVKSNSFSLVKYGGMNSWFNNSRADNKPDTYAIGLEVLELKD
jgi:hypothetical protein